MFSGEAEIQAKRRTLAVLQDESRKVLDAARDLSLAFTALLKNDQKGLQAAQLRIGKAEDDIESLRRTLTRELAEIGTMMMNREDVLRTAYNIEDIAGYLSGIAFKFSQVKRSAFRRGKFRDEVKGLVDMSVEALQRMNDLVRALAMNPSDAIRLANDVQKIEREIDDKYRMLSARLLKEVRAVKDLIILRDILESIEDMTDRCLTASDSVTILSLGL